ncbi:DUF134 domain-containing protein [Geofilum sp. OHC36d9]|uniref:DUF134 domain-containing protein n=1 Tax=Geofilum sp. OHC36d9 TaxID=3458413 RepID=UPI004034BE20
MARPKRKRLIQSPPTVEGFRPFGVPVGNLEPVVLLYEEYEALRLMDYENMKQEDAAKEMSVSRPTFTRVYRKARVSIAKALVEGKAIFIDGGNFHATDFWYRCEDCFRLNMGEKAVKYCFYCSSPALKRLDQNE